MRCVFSGRVGSCFNKWLFIGGGGLLGCFLFPPISFAENDALWIQLRLRGVSTVLDSGNLITDSCVSTGIYLSDGTTWDIFLLFLAIASGRHFADSTGAS